MLGLMAASASAQSVALSGVLTTSSASSPVTSSTRTFRGNGTVSFDSVTSDSGTPQYSKNAGAYANITEGMTLTIVDGDTIAVKCILPTSAQKAQFNVRNGPTSTSPLIEAVTLTKL